MFAFFLAISIIDHVYVDLVLGMWGTVTCLELFTQKMCQWQFQNCQTRTAQNQNHERKEAPFILWCINCIITWLTNSRKCNSWLILLIISPFLAKLAMARAPDSCSWVLELCSQDRTSWYTRPEPSAKHFCMDSSETHTHSLSVCYINILWLELRRC